MGSVVKGWKPRRAACAICGSVRGMVIVAGAGAGNGVLDVGGAECDGVPPEAIFCSLSRSFWDMYSNTDRGADGSGVSPNILPR